jgi:hypothetical protein
MYPRIILLGLLSILMAGCANDRSKTGYHDTVPLCDGRFYVEIFTIMGGGAFGGDRVSAYLTDSVNFRKYLGTYIEGKESIATECKGDSVYIYRTKENAPRQKPIIVNRWVYTAEELKKSKVFD